MYDGLYGGASQQQWPAGASSVSSSRAAASSQRRVDELPPRWRQVFPRDSFMLFNSLQSDMFDVSWNSDDNLVVGAPTGSGKTAIFE